MVMAADPTHLDTRTTPWETVGRPLRGAGLSDLLTAAGLDWTVDTHVPVVNGSDADAFRAIVRSDTDTVLGVQRKGYTTVQNAEVYGPAGLLAALLETAPEARPVSGGSIGGGRRTWVQVDLAREVTIAGDTIQPYLTLSSSHDGSAGIRASLGMLRLACTNQFQALRRSAVATWSHRHSRNVAEAMSEASHVLGLAESFVDQFTTDVQALLDTEVSDADFRRMMTQVFPASDNQTTRQRENAMERRDQVARLYSASGDDGAAYRGTGWGVVNAVNSWEQWIAPVRGKDRAERTVGRLLDGTQGTLTRRVASLVLAN